MNCLNCGIESDNLLCHSCLKGPILEKVIDDICDYRVKGSENTYINEYMETLESNRDEAYKKIFDLLQELDGEDLEYALCRYYETIKDDSYISRALQYINNHDGWDRKKQRILKDLMSAYIYITNDYRSPEKWCRFILHTDNLYMDLYYEAAQYSAKVGDYDVADDVIEKAIEYCQDSNYKLFNIYPREQMVENLEKLKKSVIRYRTKRPYWPNTEERRRAIAAIYDDKGIKHPRRLTSKPKKIEESDFQPINESLENHFDEYCSFWCSETVQIMSFSDTYEIAAVKVKNGEVIDTFQSYIRPWGIGKSGIKSTAKKAGIELEVLEEAEDVDEVMLKFLPFVGNQIMVSTGALGNQAKLISRAARYTGIDRIHNQFFDLLDYAADISTEFDMENNTRVYLLEHFKLKEGADALDKALLNIELYNLLKEMDE